jgi:hypothetical protein
MRKVPWFIYLWPGLPQLLLYGNVVGCVVAILMAVILDLLLLGTFGWSELIAQNMRTALWTICGLAWLAAGIWSMRHCQQLCSTMGGQQKNDVFRDSLNQYLKGDYFQAELLLNTLIRTNVRDLDAHLMLATLMRHTGRFEEATQQLDILVRFDGAEKWMQEIEQERDLLAEAEVRKANTVEKINGPSQANPQEAASMADNETENNGTANPEHETADHVVHAA